MPLAFSSDAFPTRLCVILTSAASGGPISGVPFFGHAAVSWLTPPAGAKQPTAWQIPLGTLATDHAGYLSYDLSVLDRRLTGLVEQLTLTTGTAPALQVDHLWLYPYSQIAQTIDALAEQNVRDDAIVVRLMVDPDSVFISDGQNFASMQSPGLPDWYLSPGSFAHFSTEIVGQDGCEALLPSNIATQTFRFVQVLPQAPTFTVRAPAVPQAPVGGDGPLGDVQALAAQIARSAVELTTLLPPGQPVDAGVGVYVMYDSSWIPVGHGLGQVLYSMPLAPAEQVNIAIIDWSRTSTDGRMEQTGLTDTLQHDTTRDRTVGEVVDATVHEWQRGGSLLGGESVTAGAAGFMGAALSLGGAYTTSSGDRNVSANTVQNLSDHFAQASTAVRDLRSTVVIQSAQQGSQNLQTRTVRNYNHSHAMTLLYYEVLRHYRVVTERGDAGPALLLPQEMPNFDETAVFAYRRFLEPTLLVKALQPGFDAVEILFALERDPPPPPQPSPADLAFNLFRIIFHCGGITCPANVQVDVGRPDNASIKKPLRAADGDVSLGDGSRFDQANGSSVEVQGIPDGASISWKEIGFFEISVFPTPDKAKETELDVNLIEVKGIDGTGQEHPMGSWSGDQKYFGNQTFPIIPSNRPPPPPPVPTALQQLTPDQRYAYVRLIAHLNSNKAYYYKQIWMGEEPSTRAARLAGVTITIGATTVPLLNVVENRVLDVLGSRVVMPLDPGIFNGNSPVLGRRQRFTLPTVDPARQEQLISLPTRGVFAEAKLGHCNASEVIDNTRFWDWQSSPIPDQAPAITGIAPVAPTPSPTLTPTAFPASLVALQAPPAEPDPVGLRAALDVLKTPGIFNNMSGVQQLQSLLSSLTDAAVKAQGIGLQASQADAKAAAPAAPPTPAGGPTPPSGPSGPPPATPPAAPAPAPSAGPPDTPAPAPTPPSAPPPAPSPTRPAAPAKSLGPKTMTVYLNFADPIDMTSGVYATGKELGGTPDNVPSRQTIFTGKPVGPVTVPGAMTVENPANKVEISVTAVVKYGEEYITTTGLAPVTLPADGSSPVYKIAVVMDTRSVSIAHTDTKTTQGIRAEIAGKLGVGDDEIGKAGGEGKLGAGITPDVGKSDATQTTYNVLIPTNKFSITGA